MTDNYRQHLEDVRGEILVIMREVKPRSMLVQAIFSRTRKAKSENEVKVVVRKLAGEGVLELAPGSEMAYVLAGATSTKVEKEPRHRDDLVKYLKENGPTASPDLVKIFGTSTYPFLKTLRERKIVYCCKVVDRTKTWDLVENRKVVQKEKEPAQEETPSADEVESHEEPESEAIDFNTEGDSSIEDEVSESQESERQESDTDEIVYITTGTMPSNSLDLTLNNEELLDEAEFLKSINAERINKILDAIEQKTNSGERVPPEWVSEMRRRLADT